LQLLPRPVPRARRPPQERLAVEVVSRGPHGEVSGFFSDDCVRLAEEALQLKGRRARAPLGGPRGVVHTRAVHHRVRLSAPVVGVVL
jgi:hypothetical protein